VIGTDAQPPQTFLTGNPWVPTFRAQAKHSHDAVIDGFEAKTPQIRHIVLQEVEKVLAGDDDPAAALKRAQQEAEKIAGK
jgi:multiple sugar transport system substrate-binding protein